jgi:succinoglycan biosynthesis protein ExoA
LKSFWPAAASLPSSATPPCAPPAGDIIYFLDDDSIAPPGNLRRALEHFQSPGRENGRRPSLCPPDAPALQQAFALTMGSWLAFGPSCSRYRARGGVRPSSEKELILCNLLARREDLLQLGGFNERFIPTKKTPSWTNCKSAAAGSFTIPALIVHRLRVQPSVPFAKCS